MENENNLYNLNPKPESKQDEFYKELKILTHHHSLRDSNPEPHMVLQIRD
jgi:hypothetical protein